MARKRSFTLIEVVVAVSISAVVIGMLISHFVQSTRLKRRIEQTANEVLNRKLIQERLMQVFGNLALSEGKKPEFSCEKNRIELLLKNGMDPDPDFSGPTKASIELDNGSLTLILKKDKKERRELIAKNIKTISWDFLSSQTTNITNDWKSKDDLLPLSIRLSITDHDDESVQYAFFPNLLPPVLKAST